MISTKGAIRKTTFKMLNICFLANCIILLMLDGAHLAVSSTATSTEKDLLNYSDYCVVNDSTIRKITGDGGLLIIVNDTGDWLVVTDGTDLFMCPTNGSNCNDNVYKPNIAIYAVQTSMYCINFLLATGTICLHFYFKELQTVFGVLVTSFCIILNVDHIVTMVHNRYQYTHKVNGDGGICATLIYVRGVLTFLYHTAKFTIFFHFTYLMYRSYRAKSDGSKVDKKLICKYSILIISLTTLYTLIAIPYDLAAPRGAFKTEGGYCAIDFLDDSLSAIVFVVEICLVSIVEIITFGIGITFYFLISKRCCELRSSDIRVCVILVSTAGLNRILFIVCYLVSDLQDAAYVVSSVATFVEQSVLLFTFLTSKKVKAAISSITSYSISYL